MKINNNKIKSLIFLSLVGSASTNEEKPTNQSALNLNSLPQIATNLTKREDNPDPTYLFAGMPIFINKDGVDQGRCMSSFAVVPTEECRQFDNPNPSAPGFLSSGLCCKNEEGCGVFTATDAGSVFLVGNGNNTQEIGWVASTIIDDKYLGNTDFAFLLSYYADNYPITRIIVPYVVGDKELYPVTGLGSVTIGSKVCAYGALGGYRCGNVVETNLVIWSGRNVSVANPNPINFGGLNKVDLGDNGFYAEEDLGGPVYTVSNIGERTTAQALGYISGIDNSDQHHRFIYYTPLEKFFETMSSKEISCYYTLLTYNETNAQQNDNLLAQMEIPAKK
jgi:hypothetical protein